MASKALFKIVGVSENNRPIIKKVHRPVPTVRCTTDGFYHREKTEEESVWDELMKDTPKDLRVPE